jgi:hypothetical protein
MKGILCEFLIMFESWYNFETRQVLLDQNLGEKLLFGLNVVIHNLWYSQLLHGKHADLSLCNGTLTQKLSLRQLLMSEGSLRLVFQKHVHCHDEYFPVLNRFMTNNNQLGWITNAIWSHSWCQMNASMRNCNVAFFWGSPWWAYAMTWRPLCVR